MKRKLIRVAALLSLILLSMSLIAQQDSLRDYPSNRPMFIQIEQSGSRKYDAQLFDEDLEKGRIDSDLRINSFLTIPILIKKKWFFTSTINYQYERLSISGVENLSNTINRNTTSDELNLHDVALSFNAIHLDSLFNKQAIFTGSLIMDSKNIKSIERVKGLITASIILKKTARETMSIGLVGFVDRSTQIPAFPIFSYSRSFKNSPWSLDFVLPSKVAFRKSLLTDGWLTIGSSLGGTSIYQNYSNSVLSGDYEYVSTEINSSIMIEYPMSESILLGFQLGLRSTVSSKLREKAAPSSDYIFETKQGSAPFMNLSFSFVSSRK